MEVEEEEEEPEPNVDGKQPKGKVQKAKSKEEGLTETKKANLFDLMLKGLADFFDQAQL